MTPQERRARVESIQDPVRRLETIMDLLRGPDGCPWDKKQTLSSLKPYLIEEAYEALDAIDDGDMEALRGELGDVLLQVVFQAQLAREAGEFDLDGVARAICDKLVHRHPHVFGEVQAETSEQVLQNWERIKTKGGKPLLAGIPRQLPALQKAHRLGEKATRVGFDWPKGDWVGPLEKVAEEVKELVEAKTSAERFHELGDLLYAISNIARKLEIDPEAALQAANDRFVWRFSHVEGRLAEQGRKPEEATLEEMDVFWNEAKMLENSRKSST